MLFQLFHILKTRYPQLGGLRLVREYARLGVLWPMVKAMARNPLSRQSYKNAYAVALPSVLLDAAGCVPGGNRPESGAGPSLGRTIRRGEMAAAHGAYLLPQIDVYEGQGACQSGGDVL